MSDTEKPELVIYRIEDENNIKIKFEELKEGDVFRYNDSDTTYLAKSDAFIPEGRDDYGIYANVIGRIIPNLDKVDER